MQNNSPLGEKLKVQPARDNAATVCLRLLGDTAKDRLQRLEANTILGNFLLLIAFHFGFIDFLIRMGITLYLNLLGYFINDYIDVEVDLANKDKDHEKALFIKEHKKAAFALILCMGSALLIFCLFYSISVCLGVIMLLLIVTIYTDYFKNRPFWDVIFIGLWGLALSWIAIPDFSLSGIKLILLLFIFGCCFETVQTLKDYEEDKKFGLATTPIVIGVHNTFILLRVLYIGAALYTILVLKEFVGILIVVPLFFNRGQNMSVYWTKLKILCGVVWLIIMVRIYLNLKL